MRLQRRLGNTHRCQRCGYDVGLSVCAIWFRGMLFEQCLHRRQGGNASKWSFRENGSCIVQLSPSLIEGFATNLLHCIAQLHEVNVQGLPVFLVQCMNPLDITFPNCQRGGFAFMSWRFASASSSMQPSLHQSIARVCCGVQW